jgi:hypothetical protein
LAISALLFVSGCGKGSASDQESPISESNVVFTSITAVVGDKTVTLAWSSVDGTVSYDIYRSVSYSDKGSKIGSVSSSATSYTDTGLTNDIAYYYVVDAVGNSEVIAESTQIAATPHVISGSVTISGTIVYQDREYDDYNGFTGNISNKAVRYGTVDLVSGSTSAVLSSTLTDGNGAFNITASSTGTVYVRINAEATLPPGSTPQIAVKNSSGSIYAVASNNFTLSGSAAINVSIPTSSGADGAFNILDAFTNGMEFIYGLSRLYPSSPLYGYWGSNSSGTYYCSSYDSTYCAQGEGIYVYNSSADTDEFDDDVLYHEFGHFTAQHFSKDDSPGGSHYLGQNDLDLRLSWSEGWGDSVPGAIKLALSSDPARSQLLSSAPGVSYTDYIDTNSSGVGIAIDMGNPDGTYGSYYYYAGNEIAIAKILLDLNKTFGMQSIWNVIKTFTATPVNLELFWDTWPSSNPTTPISTVEGIFLDRAIDYTLDPWESDNNIASAKSYTGSPQTHTLYGEGDPDYLVFSAVSGSHYTIATYNLLNGADTKLTVIKPDGTTVQGANDMGLSSMVVFTAGETGDFFVKTESSPARPDSAGRYGTYTLKITSP